MGKMIPPLPLSIDYMRLPFKINFPSVRFYKKKPSLEPLTSKKGTNTHFFVSLSLRIEYLPFYT